MNKMAKGAIATAAGVVLLIGGGGTLAVWNETVSAGAGEIQAGNLDLATGTGTWQLNGGTPFGTDQLVNNKVVPGDVLIYTQEVGIILEGKNILAKLDVNEAVTSGFEDGSFTYDVTLMNGTTAVPETELTTSIDDATAKIEFKFLDVENRVSAGKSHDMTKVGFTLTQVAHSSQPTPREAPQPVAP